MTFTLACATAQDPSESVDGGAHGDTAHADLGVGTDSAANDDTNDARVDSGGGSDTAIGSDSTIDDTFVDTGVDSGVDTGFDTGVDSGVDTTPDAIVFDTPLDGGTTVTFPSTTSTTFNTATGGTTSTLGSGGGGAFYVTGTYCEQSFPHATSVSRLDMSFRMSDLTTGCSTGATLGWDVSVNGTKVGSYSFVSASSFGDRSIVESYTFGAIAPVAGNVTIRITATSTVCPGGSSWNWYPGGTATMD